MSPHLPPPLAASLGGNHVMVTGGTKGIGRSIVDAFLAEGANVSYCGRSIDGFEIPSPPGLRAEGSAVDLSDGAAIQKWVAKAAQNFGRIDCVVACASPLIVKSTAADWEASFKADILGLKILVDAAVPHLEDSAKATGNAAVVVISSVAGFERRPTEMLGHGSPYPTLKRAQATMAKDYSHGLAPKGIRVNTVVPGGIETPNRTRPDGTVEETFFQMHKRTDPALYDRIVSNVPMGRTGRPEEIAKVVVFLSSSLASYITGANVVVDGGESIAF